MTHSKVLALSFVLVGMLVNPIFAKPPESVSMIRIIANPERYYGVEVRFAGWLLFNEVFPTKEFSKLLAVPGSGIEVHEPSDTGELMSNCDERYVVITGVIRGKGPDYFFLNDVSEVYDIDAKHTCWVRN